MRMTGGQALARQLVLEGITDVFGIPGVQLDWATDGLHEVAQQIRYWVPRHEQTAAYMADGYARTTGRIGVCMVVPGPGLLNAMAGLATAWACNSRVLAVVAQIPSAAIGKGFGMLHEIAHQSDTLRSVTKWQALARSPQDIPLLIREAIRQLSTGRPRPVAVEVPADVFAAQADVSLISPPPGDEMPVVPEAEAIRAAALMLGQARFPLIYAGGGVVTARAGVALARLAEKLQAPVVMSDFGRGALSDRHPLALSNLGGRAVFPHADVVLVAGSRFIDSTSAIPAWPQDKIRFVYLNADPGSWAPPRVPALAIHGDARLGLEALADAVVEAKESRTKQMNEVREWCEIQQRAVEPQWSWTCALRRCIPEDGILVQDLTQVTYYARAFYPLYRPRTSVTSGHQGTLGFSFPTSLGVAAGNPGRAVVCVTGDGGFGYGLAELATAAKYRLGVVTLVFNDGQFANIKHSHAAAFGRSTGYELHNPDFSKLADAFGVRFSRVGSPADLESLLPEAIASREPWLLEAKVGDMPSPWHLVRLLQFTSKHKPPPSPLGESA